MKFTKQLQVLSCLQCGMYKVEGDTVLSFRKAANEWIALKVNTLPSGYKQLILSYPSRKGKGYQVSCYLHQVIYLNANGTFNPDYQIDHEDNNKGNNLPSNVRAVPHKINLDNRPKRKANASGIRTIRAKEIEQIKTLHSAGNTQYAIAKMLNLNRLSVRYIIKRIEAGLPLKYA